MNHGPLEDVGNAAPRFHGDSEDEDEELSSAFLLPTVSPHLVPPKSGKGKTVRFADADAWDEREQVFDVGEDESDDEEEIAEELGYISPLDTVNPYVTFKHALTSE